MDLMADGAGDLGMSNLNRQAVIGSTDAPWINRTTSLRPGTGGGAWGNSVPANGSRTGSGRGGGGGCGGDSEGRGLRPGEAAATRRGSEASAASARGGPREKDDCVYVNKDGSVEVAKVSHCFRFWMIDR
jgi:hypothetical protein